MPGKKIAYRLSRPNAKQSLCIMLCLLSMIAAACNNPFGGNSNSKQLTKAPAAKQIFTLPQTGISDFDTLDPALADDPASTSAVQMIYTGLVGLNDQLEVEPQLAQSYQLASDGVTWTFKLKPHLVFNDGTPLTSADVAYSLNRALLPATKSTVAPLYLGLIKDSDQLLAGRISTLIGDSIQTPDAQTLVIVTKQQAAYFLAALTNPCSYVVEKSLITKYGATSFTDHLNEGGGDGPFKVATYVHRSHLDFVPNKDYYNKQPQLQKVSYVIYPSEQSAYQDYLNNKIDMTGVPANSYASDQKRKDFVQTPQLWINYYTMNYLTKPFDNIHIRQAFALAINKTAIAKTVWNNTVTATNHIIPAGMPSYNAAITGPDGSTNLTGNAKEAQKLLQQGLKEENWSSVTAMPAIQLTYVSGTAASNQEVTAIINDWQKVLNVQVSANAVDYNTLLDQVTAATGNATGIQMWGLSWVGEYPDPQDWLSQQFGKGTVYNNMNYGQNTSSTAAQQQIVQQQLAAADANISNAGQRLQTYQQVEQELIDDVAWLPLEQEQQIFLRNPDIVGIVDNAQSITPPDDWAKIYRVQ
jgi:oligopeptide transport system substrate-binding protein